MTCEFAHLDGSYVLGALDPSERLEFERHLAGCSDCSRSVRELAGVPGLLAHVDLADLDLVSTSAVPPSLLPSLVREVREAQRRRSLVVAAVAAAVTALAVGSLALAAGVAGDREPTAGAAPPAVAGSAAPGRPMVAVSPSPVRADVLVADVAWGTRLDLTCSYEEDGESGEEGESGEGSGVYEDSSAEYALVVRTWDGRTQQVATWKGLPGRTMRVSAATATDRSEIELVELRTADGVAVLRLTI